MKTFKFETSLILPRKLEELFGFFSDAGNLETITPSWLRFEITTPGPITIAVGTKINYKLRYRGIPLRWTSEILIWEPNIRFIDSQISGPYRKWIHEHSFHEVDGGTLCKDHVEYSVWGGYLANHLVVKNDIEKIFSFRSQKLTELFG